MKQKIVSFVQSHKYRNVYIVLVLACAAGYYFIRDLMLDMSAFGFVMSSPLTLNIIIMFGLWGGFHHIIVPVKNPYWDKVILVFGFLFIVIALRIIGLKTIFG